MINTYLKEIYIATGETYCLYSGLDYSLTLKWIKLNAEEHIRNNMRYEYVPQSCVKKMFGNIDFYHRKQWPQ
jgi:hypothetical protein